jgi:hypothetical protein
LRGHGRNPGQDRRGTAIRIAVLLATVAALAPLAPAAQAVVYSPAVSYATGTFPQAVVAADFNKDGTRDLAVVNQYPHVAGAGSVSIYVGSAGSFSAPTEIPLGTTHPLAIAIADFNGDSDVDLAVSNEVESTSTIPGTVSILLGGTGASFSAPTSVDAGIRPQSVVTGEFNGDSDPDLAVANEGSNSVSINLGSTGGTFTAPVEYPAGNLPRGVEVGEFNGDSHPDLAVANEGSNDITVLIGAAGGSFAAPVSLPVCGGPTAVATGDFNADADDDIVSVNEICHNVSVLLGGAGATFGAATTFATGNLPDGAVVGKLTSDSDPDIVVANQTSDDLTVLTGAAGGSFNSRLISAGLPNGDGPSAAAIADFNGDGAGDIAVTNEVANTMTVFLATTPTTSIDSGPPVSPSFTNDATPTFTFSSNDSSATFQCRVDGGVFTGCTSSHTTTTLSEGVHTFYVRATSDAGKTDPNPQSWSFNVDTVPPAKPVVIDTDVASPANENNPRVRGTAAAGSTVSLFTNSTCTGTAIATGTPAEFTSPGFQVTVPDNSTTTFYANARDQAGNVSACSTTSVTYVEESPPPPPPDPDPGPGTGGGSGGTPPGPSGPPPSTGSPDRSGPAMSVAGSSVKMSRRGAIPIGLGCPAAEAGGCQGTLALETLAGAAKPSKRKLRLGSSTFKLGGGKSSRITLKVSSKNRRLVSRLRRVKVLVTVTARDAAGNIQVSTKKLTLKA